MKEILSKIILKKLYMFYNIKKIWGIILLVLFSIPLFSQQTIKGTTKGIAGTTNLTELAKLELAHPVKTKVKMPAKEADEEIMINNPVNPSVIPFNGILSSVNTPHVKNSLPGVQEIPCANFNALDDNNGAFPPDVNGAAGFDHLMVTLNTQIRIQNKQGAEILTNSLTGFWNGIGGHTDIFDPKITYDPYDKRWFFVCCATRENANSALLLAVSQNYDPTGDWILYTIDADPGNQFWFDYPSLGFNRNWITVGGNMFNIPGQSNVQRGRVFVINKAAVYAGLNLTIPYFDRTDYFNISPAITYDPNDNTNWCVTKHSNNSNNNGYVRLFSITGAGPSPTFNEGNTVNVGPAWNGGGVNGPQLNSATGLDLGDDRILQTTFRNGTIWFGNNVCLPATNPTTCAVQVVSINPGTGLALENIRVAPDNTGATMSAYPSVTVNQNNDLFFGYSYFTSSGYASSAIVYRRSGQGFFNYLYKGGEDWYVKPDPTGRNRWGDYSATFIDPEDDITAWTIQEYARPRVAGISYGGTWWAKVCPGSRTNDFTLSGSNNNLMKKYEANNTITSTAQIQTNSFIKYDAGTRISLLPGFRVLTGSKFQSYIEGCGGSFAAGNNQKQNAENSVTNQKNYDAGINSLNVYPNPANGKIDVRYQLAHAANVALNLYNSDGNTVYSLTAGKKAAGIYNIAIDASSFAGGIYFMKFKTDNEVKIIKIVVIH